MAGTALIAWDGSRSPGEADRPTRDEAKLPGRPVVTALLRCRIDTRSAPRHKRHRCTETVHPCMAEERTMAVAARQMPALLAGHPAGEGSGERIAAMFHDLDGALRSFL